MFLPYVHLTLCATHDGNADHASLAGHIGQVSHNIHEGQEKCIISASADGGPCSRVCAFETLRSAPHRH